MASDLVVVGGGPAGASLARAVRGLSVVLIAQERRAVRASDDLDARVYALTPGNVGFLRDIKAWQAMPEERVAPVRAMRIFGDDGASVLEFDAYRAGVPELAWIVEDALLQDALWRDLDVEICAPAQLEQLEIQASKITLSLRGGAAIESKLVVGADGARSFVRERAGIVATESDYGQAAVVANFACTKPHFDTAYQWFQGGPVLALLPLPGERVSMVWSLPLAGSERIAALSPQELCREVERASRGVLGDLSLITAQRTFVLRRLSARTMIAPRVALVGDAAHVIHPLAGQGLNLGLQDARALAATLAAREPMRDPGDSRLLRRYERSRAEPILAMDAMVHGLFRLFGAESRFLSRLRNTGLNLTDRVPVLKNILMRQAMN